MRFDIHTVLLQKVQTKTNLLVLKHHLDQLWISFLRLANRCPAFYLAEPESHVSACLNFYIWAVPSLCFPVLPLPHAHRSYSTVIPTHQVTAGGHSSELPKAPPGAGHMPASMRKCNHWESQNHLTHQNNFKYLSGTYSAEWVGCCIMSRPLSHNKIHMAFQLDGRYWGALSPVSICNPGSY